MDNDDKPIGRVLTRREILKLAALSGGAAILAGCLPGQESTAVTGTSTATATGAAVADPTAAASTAVLPTCVVVPELTDALG